MPRLAMLAALLLIVVGVPGATNLSDIRVPNGTQLDTDTGLLWLIDYDRDIPGVWDWTTPVKHAGVIMDIEDDYAEVTDDGALLVRELGGVPRFGVDAAGAATYAALFTVTHDCTHLLAAVQTENALISLDGGAHDHLYVLNGSNLHLSGLNIPAGTTVSGKNATGVNYDSLCVSAW